MSADYWREHLDMNSIFLAGAYALSKQQETIDRYLYSELLIETATDWGLSLKEDFYGLRDGIARAHLTHDVRACGRRCEAGRH